MNANEKNVACPGPVLMDLSSGEMGATGETGNGARIERSRKTVGELSGVFLDEGARLGMDEAQVVYAVEYWKPVADGIEGGLFWGSSTVMPGIVGDEYFMTRGHFHAKRDRAEYYSTVLGSGILLLMNAARQTTMQEMRAGTTHYIPGGFAHRVVNTGEVPLTFVACWPSDAGYDYGTIDAAGFSVRVMRQRGVAMVVEWP